MQRLVLTVVTATLVLTGSAQAQRSHQTVIPFSRFVLNGHSTAALGTSVGDAFGSIDTHAGLGAGVQVGGSPHGSSRMRDSTSRSRASTSSASTEASASRISRPAPN